MRLKIRNRIYRVASFAEASAVYCVARSKSNEGASTWPEGRVTDDSGQIIARISYNGRVWKPEPWKPGNKPICEPKESRK